MIKRRKTIGRLLVVLLAILGGGGALGCFGATAEDASAGAFASPARAAVANGPTGSVGISQGGAQDFGAFREVLEAGELPAPELLDDVGFFNEHKIELPEAECGQTVCVHAELGVMGNFINGSNCTMLFIGMNTRLDEAALERKPLNLVIAVDTSGSMAGPALESLKRSLHLMLPELSPADRVSLVAFSYGAELLAAEAAPEDEALTGGIGQLQAQGGTNIYAGLEAAYALASMNANNDRQDRVLLLSDGEATAGFTEESRLLGLSEVYAKEGVALSTVGLGSSFDLPLLRELAVAGAGSFYFVEDPTALAEVFTEEIRTALVPLATDARLQIEVSSDYELRAVYGALHSEVGFRQAVIDLPTLQIAHRQSVQDNALGRRGGGGVMIAELVPKTDAESSADHEVGAIDFTFKAMDGSSQEQTLQIASPLVAGETPRAGYFAGDSVEKSFVMLNLYAGMRLALEDCELGDFQSAQATLRALLEGVQDWLANERADAIADPDIQDDLRYLRLLTDVVQERALQDRGPAPLQPRAPWPVD